MSMTDFRMALYEQLFEKPLYVSAAREGSTSCNNVLIRGSLEFALDAFRAVYWCGQYDVENELCITLVTEDPMAWRGVFLNEMPGLVMFPELADVRYVSADSAALEESYDYILSEETLQPSSEQTQKELWRLALNIDFSYAMEGDQRASKAEARARFASDPYYRASSLACAVHVPYKIAMCGDFQGEQEENLYTLIRSVAAEDALYSKLIAVEHRRWVAYMVTCGYAPPTLQQLREYAFIYPNDHRNKELKLHPCMCACDLTGRHLDEHYDFWSMDESQWPSLPKLDQVSLLLHRIATERAEPLCDMALEYFAFLTGLRKVADTTAFDVLRQSVLKLCNDEENSVRLYQEALEDAKQAAALLEDETAIQALERIEQDFAVVVQRNRRTDYFAFDAALINRLPFCLWYGVQHKTVITFTKGLLCDDVILPTLLSAEKAIFVGDFADEDHYRETAAAYFLGRGDNTQVVTVPFRHKGVEDVAARLTGLIEENEAVLINSVDCDDPEILIAIGTVASKLKVPVARYDVQRGVVPVLNQAPIGLRFVDKSLSIDEFTGLMGGIYRNVYKNVGSIDDYENFSRLFFEYSEERLYWSTGQNGKSKATVGSPWSALSTFFQSSTKDQVPNFSAGPKVPPTRYEGSFYGTVFRECQIGRFLDYLNSYRIIKELQRRREGALELVSFTYVDKLLVDILSLFEQDRTIDPAYRQDCLCKRLKFVPAMGISISGTRAVDVSLIDPSENEKSQKEKRGFVSDLRKYGMIHSVRYSADQRKVSFTFKDDKIQQLFRTQGKIFELILYHGMKSSGLFDDVQTSVQIVWETTGKPFDMMLRQRIEESGGFGYACYKKALEALKDDSINGNVQAATDNEIDVVLMRGMRPVFISCKTGKKGWNDWLNEISSISAHFHAQPALAVLKDLDQPAAGGFVARARKMGVSLLGIETISDPARFGYAIREIAAGRAVFGPDTKAPEEKED